MDDLYEVEWREPFTVEERTFRYGHYVRYQDAGSPDCGWTQELIGGEWKYLLSMDEIVRISNLRVQQLKLSNKKNNES